MAELLLIINATATTALSAVEALNAGLEIVGRVGSAVSSILGATFDVATTVFMSIMSGLESIAEFVLTNLSNAFAVMRDDWLQFEKDAGRIFGNIANEAGSSLNEVKDIGLQVSNALGKDIEGVMEGLYEVISGGFRDVEDAGTIMMSAGKLAQTGWIEMDDVMNVMISTLNSYGLAAADAERVSAMLFQTQIQGRGNMKELARLMGGVLPIASALGITMEDASAATAGVTQVMGAQGHVMFSITSSLNQLVKPTKMMIGAWAKYGFQVTKAADGTIDLRKTLEDLRAIRAQFGDDVIGEMFSNQAAVRGIGALTNISEEAFNTIFDNMRNGAKSMDDFNAAVEATLATISYQLELWETRFKNLGIVVFELLQGAFRPVFDDIIIILEETGMALDGLATSGVFEVLLNYLQRLVEQMRGSAFYQQILADIRQGIMYIIEAIPGWVDGIWKVVESGQALSFFNTVGEVWNSTIAIILEAVTAWATALGKLGAQGGDSLAIISKAVQMIGEWFLHIIIDVIPKFLSALEAVDVAGLLAGWIRSFQGAFKFVVALAVSMAQGILSALSPIIDNWEILVALVRSVGFAFSALGNHISAFFNSIALMGEGVTKVITAIGELLVKLVRTLTKLGEKLPNALGGSMFEGMDDALATAEDFLATMKDGTHDSAVARMDHITNLMNAASGDNAKSNEELMKAIDGSSVNRTQPMIDALAAMQTHIESGVDDPALGVNQFLDFLDTRSADFQANQAEVQARAAEALNTIQDLPTNVPDPQSAENQLLAQQQLGVGQARSVEILAQLHAGQVAADETARANKEAEIALQEQISTQVIASSTQSEALHNRSIAALQSAAAALANHTARLAAQQTSIEQLQAMMTG